MMSKLYLAICSMHAPWDDPLISMPSLQGGTMYHRLLTGFERSP